MSFAIRSERGDYIQSFEHEMLSHKKHWQGFCFEELKPAWVYRTICESACHKYTTGTSECQIPHVEGITTSWPKSHLMAPALPSNHALSEVDNSADAIQRLPLS